MGAGRQNCQDGKRHIGASVTVMRVFVRSFPFLILHIHVIFAVFGFCVLGGVKVLYISAMPGNTCFQVVMASRGVVIIF